MILKSLRISPKQFYQMPGPDNPYIATVEYRTHGEADITMPLGPQIAQRLLEIVADELVKASKAIANNLTSEIITAGAAVALAAPQKVSSQADDDDPL
jgi:hypothetical protein